MSHMTDFERLTECCICFGEFVDPRILPCIHTFCLQCLQQTGATALKEPVDNIGLPCPLCRKEFRIPEEGMSGLPKNFFMQNLLEVNANMQLYSRLATVCDICKEMCEADENTQQATKRCLECRNNFCDRCSKAHTLHKLSKDHHVVEIGSKAEEDMRNMFSTRNCPEHENKSLESYCVQCKIVVCVSCVVENHASHRCKDVGKVEHEFRQVIGRNAFKISLCADEVLPRIKSVDEKKNAILSRLESIEREIRQRNVELKEMIDSCTESLVEELSLMKQKHVKDCDIEKEEIERRHIILKSFETYCSELKSKGSASDICGYVDELTSRANDLERDHDDFIGRPFQTTEFSFTPAAVAELGNTTSTNIVGKIQETFTEMENCVFIVGLNDGRNSMKDVFSINLHRPHEISTLQQIPTKVQNGAAAAVYGNSMYITGIGDSNAEIWRYNPVSGWWKCASLVHSRSGHSAAFIDGILYICGGWLSPKSCILKSVEAYSAAENTCSVVGKLVYHVLSSGNCVPFKNLLYIFGGSDKFSNALNKVQVYDTKQNTCSLLSKPMPRSCKSMRAALWDTSAILLGSDTCFLFDFETETFQERNQFKTDVVHFGLVIENERIFVIGGEIRAVDDGGNWSWKCRDDVRYVPLKGVIDDKPPEWKSYGKLAKPVLIHCYGKILFMKT